MISTRCRQALTLMALATSLACSSDGTGPGGDSSGRYVLTAIAGRSMPTWQINEPSLRLDILSGEFTLSPNGTAVTELRYRLTTNGVQMSPAISSGAGTYTLTGGILTMDMSGSAEGVPWQKVSIGTVQGSVVLFDDGQGVLQYEKR